LHKKSPNILGLFRLVVEKVIEVNNNYSSIRSEKRFNGHLVELINSFVSL
jgi:hypothetical protein